jgi:hypothetical protein
MRRAADEVFPPKRGKLDAGDDDFPNFSGDLGEKRLWRAVCEKLAMSEDGDVGSHGFDVGDDVRGEDDDALAGKLREKIAKADAFFGIESRGGLIDDEELRIVE